MTNQEKLSMVWYPRKADIEQKLVQTLLNIEYAWSDLIAPVVDGSVPAAQAKYDSLQIYYTFLQNSLTNINARISVLVNG